MQMKSTCDLILSRIKGPRERDTRRFITAAHSTKRWGSRTGRTLTHRVVTSRSDKLKWKKFFSAAFVTPDTGVSHDFRNATERIPILCKNRDRDGPVRYCSHCLLDTEAGGSLSSE